MTTLGVDVGTVRIGLAVGDPTGTIATPLETRQRQPEAALWQGLHTLISERGVTTAVVGLPRRMDGREAEAAALARDFAAELRRRTGIDVEMWDERLTTVQAERSMIAAGTRRRQRRERIDAVAAALILQSWLDARTRAR